MNRKSVTNRKCIVIAGSISGGHLIKDEDGLIVFNNRNDAKEYIEDNQKDLRSTYGLETIYVIALLDWEISFKQSDVKMVIK